jgi:hypothetical protein
MNKCFTSQQYAQYTTIQNSQNQQNQNQQNQQGGSSNMTNMGGSSNMANMGGSSNMANMGGSSNMANMGPKNCTQNSDCSNGESCLQGNYNGVVKKMCFNTQHMQHMPNYCNQTSDCNATKGEECMNANVDGKPMKVCGVNNAPSCTNHSQCNAIIAGATCNLEIKKCVAPTLKDCNANEDCATGESCKNVGVDKKKMFHF